MSNLKQGPSTAGTTNSTVSLPSWFTDAWQSILGAGSDLAQNQHYYTAGLVPDQITSSIAANNALDQWLSRPQIPAYDVFGMASTPSQLYIPGSVSSLQQSVSGGFGTPAPQRAGSRDAPTTGQAAQAQAHDAGGAIVSQ
jgi:hypothetical protein